MKLSVSLAVSLWLTLGVGDAQVLSYPGGKGSVVTVTNHIGTLVQQSYQQFKDARRDFGAVCDGVADDTAALQSALDSVSASHDVLFIPQGTCRISSTLLVRQKSSFRVMGASKSILSTVIRWVGPQGGTMLMLDGVRDSEWSDLYLDGNAAADEPAVIIDIDKVTAGPVISRKNSFYRMTVRGGSVATVRIAHTSTTNNEAHVFEDVESYSIVVKVGYGYLVENINAKNIQIVRGLISGKATAVQIDEGSIHLHSVELGGNGKWISVGGGGEPIVIMNCDGDSNQTFLELRPGSTNPIFASGNRFVQSVDGDLFTLNNNSGPVTLIGNDFSSGGYRAGATTTISSNGPRMTAIGNVFPNKEVLPFPDPPAVRFSGLYALGNQFFGPGNVLTTMNDYLVPHRSAGTSYSTLQMSGAAGYLADAYAVPSVTGQFVATSGTVTFSAAAPYTLITEPTVLPGKFDGQRLLLINVGVNAVTLQDRGTLAGSGIALTANTLTIGPRQSVSFTWSATLSLWIQTGPLVAPL